MSEIDKALPNEVRKEINIPGVEEIQVELEKEAEQETKGPVEVQQNEDGSVDIDFDPSAVNIEGTQGHFSNLVELLPDDVLDPLGSQMYENYTDYKSSRKDWERTYTSGLELLGFNYDDRTEPFKGASGATHPVLAEAVTQFQALAYKGLLPDDVLDPLGSKMYENYTDYKSSRKDWERTYTSGLELLGFNYDLSLIHI